MVSVRQAVVAGALIPALVLSACSDDDGGGDAASDSTRSEGSSPSNVATGDPIRIGFVTIEGGTLSFPETRIGAEVAADYVNEELGGINGRPIEYEVCKTDGSPESSVDCANQLVESGVAFVQEGIDIGSDAMLPILRSAGLPLVGHVAFGAQQQQDPDSFFFGAPVPVVHAAALTFWADEGADSATFFMSDTPLQRAVVSDYLEPFSDEVGIDFEAIFFDAGAADWNVLAATAMADAPDVIGSSGATEQDCVGFVGALKAAAYDGDVFAAACTNFIDQLGPEAEGTVIFTDQWRADAIETAPEAKQAELELYVAAMEEAGEAERTHSFARSMFADTVNLARILSAIEGEIDGTSVADALRATVEFDAFSGPDITCDGSVAPGQNGCTPGELYYEVQGDGSLRLVSDGFVLPTDLLNP